MYHEVVRRHLLPILTRPVLPQALVPADAQEYRDVLEICWLKVDAEERRLVLLPVLTALGTPMLVTFVWFRLTGTRNRDVTAAWAIVGGMAVGGVLGVWAVFLISARYMRPHLLAELHARGLCQGCGYDLRGEATVCPECGKATHWPDWSWREPPSAPKGRLNHSLGASPRSRARQMYWSPDGATQDGAVRAGRDVLSRPVRAPENTERGDCPPSGS